MLFGVLQALACTLGLSGCGGGGDGDAIPNVLAVSADAPTSTVDAMPSAQALSAAATGINFSFTLSSAQTTSAGVYTPGGVLVRTLWRGQALSAGSYQRSWDQKDDSGNLMPAGSYTVKVLHHNVQYVWQGVVGNTSATAQSAVLHRSLNGPMSLASTSGGILYSTGYNEGQSMLNGFTLANPQLNTSPARWTDAFTSMAMIATDGVREYAANTGGAMAATTFVAAFAMNSGQQATFEYGTSHCLNYQTATHCYPQQTYPSVIDFQPNANNPPTGLAVQASGNLLAVAYGSEDVVKLFDKTSGAPLGSISTTLVTQGLNQIAFSPAGDLWVLTPQGASRYTGLPSHATVSSRITGLVAPLAITVDKNNQDSVWIADGAGSQQVKRYSHLGVLAGEIGVAGGYAGTTTIENNRFNFAYALNQDRTGLAVDDAHNLWVIDTADNRIMQFSLQGTYLNQIVYQPMAFSMAVDTGNPTRVFLNYLEFSVDYSLPLTNPNAWKLVRNWMNGLPASLVVAPSSNYYDTTANWAFTGLHTVQTMSNGRTYALTNAISTQYALVELQANGQVRFIQWLPSATGTQTLPVLYENGDLGWSQVSGQTQSVMRQTLTGFNASGNPVWGTAKVIASVPVAVTTPYISPQTWTGLTGARFPITGSGQVVWFNPGVLPQTGFHLGAVAQGGTSFAWQASPSGPMDGAGSFQTQATDPNVQYGGNMVFALNHDIIYGYHGEGFTDPLNHQQGEANQWMHFRDDGLFVGQFGVASTRATTTYQPGLSGNCFSATVVQVNGQVYVYHNDAATFGGIHRWLLSGLSSIAEVSASVATGAAVAALH